MEEQTLSQKQRIRAWLESGRTLTPLDALHLFNSFSLAQRIKELRREGMAIKTTMIEIKSGGKKKHIAKYSIKKS